ALRRARSRQTRSLGFMRSPGPPGNSITNTCRFKKKSFASRRMIDVWPALPFSTLPCRLLMRLIEYRFLRHQGTAGADSSRQEQVRMTKVLDWQATDEPGEVLDQAVHCLREGNLVAFPTETVYGVAASVLVADAVARLCQGKGRPQGKPLTLAIGSAAEAL